MKVIAKAAARYPLSGTGAAPEPEVLRIIGEESERNRTNTPTSRQIDQVIKATRVQKQKR